MTRSRGQAPIRFHVLTAAQLSATDLQFAFELLKSNMRELYADEWSDVEKREELTHSDARYLIGSIDDEAVAYLCFRFTLEEKVTCDTNQKLIEDQCGKYTWYRMSISLVNQQNFKIS